MILVNRNFLNLLLLNIILFSSCSKLEVYSFDGTTMGTTYSIKIRTKNTCDVNQIRADVDSLLLDINYIFSTYIHDSEISKINTSKQFKNNVSSEFSDILNKSLYYADLSNGLYDPTVYPLVDIWGFASSIVDSKPSEYKIKETKKNVNYKFLKIDKNMLFKNNNRVHIDLSSIAKGYAVDEITEFLDNKGYSNFMVEIGGEVRCNSDNNNFWNIGIASPYDKSLAMKVKLYNHSIATSGNYNNFTEYDGVEYSHIINPKTGYPIATNILSCTIISAMCVDADALATVLMTLAPMEGLRLINDLYDTECMIINRDKSGKINKYFSRGFEKFIVD